MKTAAKIYLSAVLSLGAFAPGLAWAQGISEASVAVAATAKAQGAATAAAADNKVDSAVSSNGGISGVLSQGVTVSSPPPALTGLGKDEKSDPSSSKKVPESVKSVVKRLDAATEDVTLEDLNAAREAVAKLDVLIDIEKRLSDLAKIRQDREEVSMDMSIPSSAFGGRGMPAPSLLPPGMQAAPPVAMAPAMPVASKIQVERILGTNGQYVAYVKADEGKTEQVREGDQVADGSVVESITAKGVTLLKNKKKRTLHVNKKDVTSKVDAL
ncbi:MAG: type IV pilus biogenesis protein PilP [Alphaproteobacteria bacterium]|nr:type IV pilus biogenesis protein PilP [Alphaproteobacteria bacterium]